MFLRRKAIQQASDEDLVQLLRKGDRASLGYLWDRYAHLLFGTAMKYLKDVERSKDEVAGLFEQLPDLLRKHPVERFRPWVHTVMRNRCLMSLRKEQPVIGLNNDPGNSEDHDAIADKVLHEATLERLELAIAQLNEQQRTCIQLFYLQRHSYQEVARLTGMDLEQVRSNLQNGRRNLKLKLQQQSWNAA